MRRHYNHNISEKANESLARREAVVRSQKRMIAIVIIIVISLGILLGTGINALASSKIDPSSYNKYYTSIQIQDGDTLWSIADEYIADFDVTKEEYISEICQMNHIHEDDITAGDYLVVAYYSKDIK